MIGNAHIDPVWLWQWPEGYQEVRATFQSAVDRMDEYPDFVFTCDSSLFFDVGRGERPGLFEKIRERVAEGRLQVVGGWWVEPDCNIPCGESFVRQALYGQRYLREKFGIIATTGANIDSFGHNATIPQILAKQRLRLVRVPATRARREAVRQPALPVGVRRTARGCSPTASRTSTARRRTTSASTSTRRSRRCRDDGRLMRSSTASATTAEARRSPTSIASRVSTNATTCRGSS